MSTYTFNYKLPTPQVISELVRAADHAGPLPGKEPGAILWETKWMLASEVDSKIFGRIRICNGTVPGLNAVSPLPATIHFMVEGKIQKNSEWHKTLHSLQEGESLRHNGITYLFRPN